MKKLIMLVLAIALLLNMTACMREEESATTKNVGNLAGNVNNGGFAAMQDNWIYYSNRDDNSFLYKIHIDGTKKTKLSETTPVGCINVIGDWVYYAAYIDEIGNCAVYKIRTDGTDETHLFNAQVAFMQVVGDWIFYADTSREGWGTHKIRVDGTEQSKISSHWFIPVDNADWIYYENKDESGYGTIYKSRTDGTNETELFENIGDYKIIDNDWIYYVPFDNNFLHKVRTDGTDNTSLNVESKSAFIVSGDWIYYFDNSRKINRIRTDGTENTLLLDEEIGSSAIATMNVVGDWIYFAQLDNNLYRLYRMRTDGTERQIVD